MTFQEALSFIDAEKSSHDREAIQKAINTLNFFKHNVLELEDYEIDELYKVMRFLQTGGLKNE